MGEFLRFIANTRDLALGISLVGNALLCAACVVMWRSKQRLSDRIMTLCVDMVRETSQVVSNLIAKQ